NGYHCAGSAHAIACERQTAGRSRDSDMMQRRGTTMATATERAGGTPAATPPKSNDLERVRRTGVVAIMRHTEASLATEAAEALLRGGVDVVEVTMNTAGAMGMIRQLAAQFGERLLVGAGTVLSTGAV